MFQPSQNSYPAYYHSYIVRALGAPLLEQLETHLLRFGDFFKNIPEELQEHRYEKNKWTPKDILLHLIDTERVFSYRALKIARGEGMELSSFDQDVFVEAASANDFKMSDLVDQYTAVRQATITLFRSFSDPQLEHKGSIASNPISVGALGFIILGHELHHVHIIKERYL